MKPCKHESTVEGCGFCKMYETSAHFRDLWDGKPGLLQQAASFGRALAEHALAGFPVVDKTERLAVCTTCDQFDAATTRCNVCRCLMSIKAGWAEQECPLGKWAKKAEPVAEPIARTRFELSDGRHTFVDEHGIPYGRPVVRHLAYHVAPVSGNGTWHRNVENLRRRIGLFNGRRTVAIVTGDGLDPPDDVKMAFACDVDDFIIMPNSPPLREVATFLPLLERCCTTAPYETTFYAHAKGVTRPVNDGVTVHRWTDIMYEANLDHWPLVEEALLTHPIAGAFKKVGNGFSGSRSSWHFSGTFYWLRNAMVFTRPWREIDQTWTGTEAWPGLHFKPDEAACLFHAGEVPTLDLYSMDYLRGTVEPAYEQWRQERQVTHA